MFFVSPSENEIIQIDELPRDVKGTPIEAINDQVHCIHGVALVSGPLMMCSLSFETGAGICSDICYSLVI